MRSRNCSAAILLMSALFVPCGADAIESMRIADGLPRPIYLTSPPNDSRLFVIGQDGQVTVHEASGTLIGTFLDIDPLVSSVGERGLHSIAFPPDYAASGIFYASYTNNSGNTTLSRFQLTSDNDADEASEEIIFTQTQPNSNHNGGRILFGDDGYLYLALGDGGGANDTANNAQTLTTLLGKMIRIDVSGGVGTTYTVPPDNPFVGSPADDEIWAYGLRNPWGFSKDLATGDFYIADVGQELWEEVNVQSVSSSGGENYGWRLMEGAHCFNPPTNCNDGSLILPVHEYSSGSGSGNCSITGGFVYRGTIAEIDGHYFFADWCSERIWSFVWDGGGGITDFTERTAELTPGGGLNIDEIGGFGQDSAGNVYLLDRGSSTIGSSTGELFKIVDSSVVVPPPTPPAPIITLKALPNPFKFTTRFKIETGIHDDAVVTIVDLSGRLIRRVATGTGSGTFEWNGRDENGQLVAAGTYLVQVIVGDQKATRRVTFVR